MHYKVMFSSIHDNVYLDTDDYQLCVHSCILVDLAHFDVACVVYLTGWNSATLGGSYKCMFLSNYDGIFLPLVCRLFFIKYIEIINMLTCRILMSTCSTTVLTYSEISFLIMMYFDSTVYRNVSHTTCHPEPNV